ncbi:MAG TPA: DUF4129 domain-containing protein [Acidimicrobiales bacterium]|nr:DUF4129 domain-containing protein [Acidimicrobiales bacterium]
MLRADWAQTLPPPTADPEEVRRSADEILGRPEFQEPPRSWYQRALDWIGDLLADALGSLIAGGTGAVVAWALLALVVVAVTVIVVRAVQRDRRRPSPNRDGPTIDVASDTPRPPEVWAAEADRLEGEGRWREALRCRYRSLVATLARTGVVEEVPGRTAGEYRTLVARAKAPVAQPFTDATDLFEQAWYGFGETGAAESAAFRRLADRVTSS